MDISGLKILVTGASGRLGGEIVRALAARGINPITHVRQGSDTSLIDRLGLERRTADLRNRPEVLALMDGVDMVIHTAALVDFRGDRMTQFAGLNTIGALETYNAARRAGVKRFVHVSTVAAVGAIPRREAGIDTATVDETLKFNLRQLRIPYIVTKRAAEEELLKASAECPPELVIVNPSIIIAPSGIPGGLANLQRRLSGWLPSLETRFNVVDVRDVACGVVAALEKGRSGERYILGGDNITLRELATLAGPYLNKRPRFIKLPRWMLLLAARGWQAWARARKYSRIQFYPDLVRLSDYDWVFSSARAERELGYEHRPLAETLRDLWSNRN